MLATKPTLPQSSYRGGPDLDGSKKLSSAGINSNTIILEDDDSDNHKAGKNAIRLDGSFSQKIEKIELTFAQKRELLSTEEREELDQQLLTACQNSGLEALKRLIGEGANINAKNGSGQTAFGLVHRNIGNEDLAIRFYQTLMNAPDFNPNLVDETLDFSPLLSAAESGLKSIVEELLEFPDIRLDSEDGTGWTALHHAANENSPDIIDLLLKAGADPNIHENEADFGEFTPLHLAADNNDVDCVRKLLADPRTRTDINASFWGTAEEVAWGTEVLELLQNDNR